MITTVSLEQALFDGAKEVFESMVFMTLEKSGEDFPTVEGECILGTITFKGAIKGCLGVCCTMECAKAIAANMTGAEFGEEVSIGDISDAMGEIANMVMGSLKTRIGPQIGNIEVSIPSVVKGTGLDAVLVDPQTRVDVAVAIDEHAAMLILLSKTNT